MKTLDQIGIHFQTDKASQFSRTYAKPHNYLVHLERFVEPMRYNPIKILEIGVGGGESIRTWLEYFPKASIYGVDIVSNTNDWNTPGDSPTDGYTFACGDQSDPKFWSKFIEVYGGDWDVVIDDGAHISGHITSTFYSLWPVLKSGGVYEIEDLRAAPEAANWLHRMAPDVELGQCDIDSIYFARELAILRKK